MEEYSTSEQNAKKTCLTDVKNKGGQSIDLPVEIDRLGKQVKMRKLI